jgi:lipopolysaccharide export system permease protein
MTNLSRFKEPSTHYITILDRYLCKQFLGPFSLAVGGFALIGIIDILFYVVELAIISGISFLTILRLLIYKLPAIMVIFFPMAVLFSMMLLLVRMAKDNELTVLRTSGIPTSRILLPLLLLTLGFTLLSYIVNEQIVPWTNKLSDNIIRKEITKKPPPVITENIVFKDGEGRHFYIKKVNTKKNIMNTILIFEKKHQFPRLISAEKAHWNNSKWSLLNGYILEFNKDGLIDFSDHFDEMTLSIDQDFSTYYNRQKTAKEMDSKELKKRIHTLAKGGINTRSLKVEYHMKKSIPAACFIFSLIGIALCLSFVRSGKDWWGVIFVIIIAILSTGLYFFGIALFRALAKDGTLPPLLGVWIPNLMYGSIASTTIYYQCKHN